MHFTTILRARLHKRETKRNDRNLKRIHYISDNKPKTCSQSLDVLCFDPLTRPKMPFKVMHRKEVTHSNGSYERKSRGLKLADEMGRGKNVPLYSHRLTHRKRVTCELHDSYLTLDDDHTGHSKVSGSDTSRSLDIGRSCGGVSISPCGCLKVI